MSTAQSFNGWAPEGTHGQLPAGGVVGLQADEHGWRGQFLTYNATGAVKVNDGTVPGLICAGVVMAEMPSESSPVEGAAQLDVWTGYSSAGFSTISGDTFATGDVCTPAWIAGPASVGKKSNYLGANRSLAGLVVSLYADTAPRTWAGPIAQAVARGVLMADAASLAWTEVLDAAASTATAEMVMPRAKVHGTVTSIAYTGGAIVANNTDYVTATISKRDGAGGAAVVIGTYDSRAANQGGATAFTPVLFSLSVVAGALALLETDVVTLTIAKGGAGKIVAGTIVVTGKVL